MWLSELSLLSVTNNLFLFSWKHVSRSIECTDAVQASFQPTHCLNRQHSYNMFCALIKSPEFKAEHLIGTNWTLLWVPVPPTMARTASLQDTTVEPPIKDPPRKGRLPYKGHSSRSLYHSINKFLTSEKRMISEIRTEAVSPKCLLFGGSTVSECTVLKWEAFTESRDSLWTQSLITHTRENCKRCNTARQLWLQ